MQSRKKSLWVAAALIGVCGSTLTTIGAHNFYRVN